MTMKDPLLRPVKRSAPPSVSKGDQRLIRAMSAHVETHIGRIDWVLHDLKPDVVHVDLLWVQPGPHRDFHTFITCGMSERAMSPPRRARRCRHAELLLRLPPTWKLRPSFMTAERSVWPLRELAELARLPHVYETWLWAGYTVPNGDPPEPLSKATKFSGSIVAPASWTPAGFRSPPASWTPAGFRSLQIERNRSVQFFSVIPAYAEELLLARDAGTGVVLEMMERAGVTDLLDSGRPNLGSWTN
jgi:hypothetical protein